MLMQSFVKLSVAVHEYRVHREKKLRDDARNNTAFASAGSEENQKISLRTVAGHKNWDCDDWQRSVEADYSESVYTRCVKSRPRLDSVMDRVDFFTLIRLIYLFLSSRVIIFSDSDTKLIVHDGLEALSIVLSFF